MEIALLTGLYYPIWRLLYDESLFPAYLGNGKYVLTLVYALLTMLVFSNFDGFRFGYLRLSDTAVAQAISMLIVNVITYFQLCLIANVMIPIGPMLLLTVLDAVLIFLCVYLFTALYHRIYIPKNMIMIFGNPDAVSLKLKMDTRSDKYHIAKLVHESMGFDRIRNELGKYDAVVINDISAQLRNDILKYCYQHGIRTYVAPKISDIIIRGATEITLFDTPLFLVRGKGPTPTQRFYKRLADIILSTLALILSSPFMAIIAIAIKLEDGGPVFYKQKRATLRGKEFNILKFRSMVVDADKFGAIPTTSHDPRITKVGRIIRATRMDELPQFINILKGDMSLVGPRPEHLEHVRKYCEQVPEFACRLKVKGGLTGYAQIYGKYNTSAYDKLRLDLLYIENYSLLLDVKLILQTIRIVLKKESTEGFDIAEKMDQMTRKILEDLEAEKKEGVAEK